MKANHKGVEFVATPDVTTQLHSVLELLRAGRAQSYTVHTTAGPLEVTTEAEALDVLEACIRARDAAHGGPVARVTPPPVFVSPAVHDVTVPALARMEAAKAKLDTRNMPAEVRKLLEAEAQDVGTLIQEYSDLTNLIMQGLATAAQTGRQQKLHALVQWTASQQQG